MNPSDQARQVGVVDSWLNQLYTYGFGSNPTPNLPIGQLTGLAAGYYDVTATLSLMITATNSSLRLVWSNGAGVSKLWVLMHCGAGSSQNIETHWDNIKMNANDQLELVVGEAFTGAYAGTILAIRRA